MCSSCSNFLKDDNPFFCVIPDFSVFILIFSANQTYYMRTILFFFSWKKLHIYMLYLVVSPETLENAFSLANGILAWKILLAGKKNLAGKINLAWKDSLTPEINDFQPEINFGTGILYVTCHFSAWSRINKINWTPFFFGFLLVHVFCKLLKNYSFSKNSVVHFFGKLTSPRPTFWCYFSFFGLNLENA